MSSGADIVASALRRHGVECVFGVPGSQNLTLFEVLKGHGIRTVLTSSETAAGFMALGWHRASGGLGVYSAISGPGFAYAIPPLAEAVLDSSELMLIAGVGPGRKRVFDLQEINQTGIAGALCGPVACARETDEVEAAFASALTEIRRHGPRPAVFLHTKAALEGDTVSTAIESKVPPVVELPEELAGAVAECRRPLIFIGAEAIDAADEIDLISERLGAVVLTTPSARGVLPETDGRVIAIDLLCDDSSAVNKLIESADLVLAVGCRFSHNGTGGFALTLPAEKLAHVHPDAAVLDENYPAKWALCGTSASFLDDLREFVLGRPRQEGWPDGVLQKHRQRILRREAGDPAEPDWPDAGYRGCRPLMSALREALPDDAMLVTDTGNHQIFVRKYFEVRSPRGLICPVDLQSMGFGLPAAIGASLAAEHRSVVAVIGDGGLLMMSAELASLARLQAPLTVVVLADGYLGQIRAKQVESGFDEEMTTLQMPDLDLLSQSYGIHYERANEKFPEQLSECVASRRPALIEIRASDSSTQKRNKAWRRVRRKLGDAIRGVRRVG